MTIYWSIWSIKLSKKSILYLSLIHISELIDEEVKRMVNEQYDRAKRILSEHKEGHNELTQLLIDKEDVYKRQICTV